MGGVARALALGLTIGGGWRSKGVGQATSAHQGFEECGGLRVTMWREGAACGQLEEGVGCDKQSLAHPADRVQALVGDVSREAGIATLAWRQEFDFDCVDVRDTLVVTLYDRLLRALAICEVGEAASIEADQALLCEGAHGMHFSFAVGHGHNGPIESERKLQDLESPAPTPVVVTPTSPPTPEPTPARQPTAKPTPEPTPEPTTEPTAELTVPPNPEPPAPTLEPTAAVTVPSTPEPTAKRTEPPTAAPPAPTPEPTAAVTVPSTPEPTAKRTEPPTAEPPAPTREPTEAATVPPTPWSTLSASPEEVTCASHECSAGFISSADNPDTECDDGECDDDQCCTETATCEGYDCSDSVGKIVDDPVRVTCGTSECSVAECCRDGTPSPTTTKENLTRSPAAAAGTTTGGDSPGAPVGTIVGGALGGVIVVGAIITAVLCKTGRLQYNTHGNSSKQTAAPTDGSAPADAQYPVPGSSHVGTGTHYPVPGPSQRGTHYPSVVEYPRPA